MHWPNLYDMTSFLTLEYAISATASHTCHVQQLRAVDHMVVCQERLAITPGTGIESLSTREKTDPRDERHRRLWLQLGNKDFPHPPITLP
jgi:hypothetical protein